MYSASGVPKDMATRVAFLVSDRAAFITGEVINGDGGRLMNIENNEQSPYLKEVMLIH
jgi:NAD(P)-dependent dehydrogenase (short-subunit alcohol dehydrogenase family)